METSEFQEDIYYSGTVEDPARYRISLNDHKTAGVYGATVVRLYDYFYKLIEMYLRTVRTQITTLDPKVEQVFVSSNRNVVLNVVASVHFCLQNLPARRYSDKRKDMRNNSQEISRYWNARTHAWRAGTFSCPGTTQDTNASGLLPRPWQSIWDWCGSQNSKEASFSENNRDSRERREAYLIDKGGRGKTSITI